MLSSPSLNKSWSMQTKRSMQDILCFVFLCISPTQSSIANKMNEVRSLSLFSSSTRATTQKWENSTSGRCHLNAATAAVQKTISGRGIVFAIQSNVENLEGLTVTSFGIHVDRNAVNEGGLGYEVYALKDDRPEGNGYYANPIRNENNTGEIVGTPAYDYRGYLENWDLISKGVIYEENLQQSITTLEIRDNDYYQIPYETFNSTKVPGGGGIRSFYITTLNQGFIYSDPCPVEIQSCDVPLIVNDVMDMRTDSVDGPIILVGEGIVSYPMPDSALFYTSKSFVGDVYYEMECPTAAPSQSTFPSSSPTFPLTGVPSSVPTVTSAPSEAPSVVASEVPSIQPTITPTVYTEQISDGLLLTILMVCFPGETPPQEDIDAVAGAVIQSSVEAARASGVTDVNATVVGTSCSAASRRLSNMPSSNIWEQAFGIHRKLPTGSSSIDFSVVITGEYKPPLRPDGAPEPERPDLGALTEDSINSDPETFVKDLQARAGAESEFASVESDGLAVETFEVPDNVDLDDLASIEIVATRSPTRQPTQPPTVESNSNVLVICIVITAGIIVLLSAFLFFRHGERKASKRRRKKMEEKERRRMEKKANKYLESKHQATYPGYYPNQSGLGFYGNHPPHGYPYPPQHPPQQQGYPPPPHSYQDRIKEKEERNAHFVDMLGDQQSSSVRWKENDILDQ